MTFSTTLQLMTKGFSDIPDLAPKESSLLESSAIREGIVTVPAIGSTASVTTIEYEPALVEDFHEKLEQLVSRTEKSRHSETRGDDNGFSHVRASLMGPSLTLPVSRGRLVLGTWQQIVFIDHDNRP
ncbi:MAG: YjbQ family protein [Chlorobiaceae bacterium]|nr:YjbQ family protein [Chlorobiaceae bacterium]NTW11523.1 YjbQ family protein [Chlorobiaceae bacterium]